MIVQRNSPTLVERDRLQHLVRRLYTAMVDEIEKDTRQRFAAGY
jgi:hypothetical protein